MIDIRRATVQDTQSISHLGATTFDEAFGHLFIQRDDLNSYLTDTFAEEKIFRSLQKEKNVYWLATEDGVPVGYAKLQLDAPSEFIDSTKVCKLQKIYFLGSHVSKGIGSRLQQLVFEKAVEHNNHYLWLSALKENVGAVKFYERNDYEIVGEHPFTIGEQKFEFWVMGKKLV